MGIGINVYFNVTLGEVWGLSKYLRGLSGNIQINPFHYGLLL